MNNIKHFIKRFMALFLAIIMIYSCGLSTVFAYAENGNAEMPAAAPKEPGEKKGYNFGAFGSILGAPTPGITVNGADTVEKFATTSYTAQLPSGVSGTVVWSVEDTSIATVTLGGVVMGISAGTTRVYATVQYASGKYYNGSKEITVTETGKVISADFYYLRSPTSDPNANYWGEWGDCIGSGTINMNGVDIDYRSNQNSWDNTQYRVITWPAGYENGVIPRDGKAWKDILNHSFFSGINSNDIVEMRLVPYKISDNNDNGREHVKHVDCLIEVTLKETVNKYVVDYYLWDAGKDSYAWQDARDVQSGTQVNATTVTIRT